MLTTLRPVIAVLIGSALGLSVPAQALELHVSPEGSDANDGTLARPFRTPERARDEIRGRAAAPEGGVTVWLHAGTYHLSAPFSLTEEDSGSPDAPVVYSARSGEEVWLSGGHAIRLSEFAPVTDEAVLTRLAPEARENVLRVGLDAGGECPPQWADHWWDMRRVQTSLFELFADGRRLTLARWPNSGYARFGEIIEAAKDEGDLPRFAYGDSRPERWNVDAGVWLYGYWSRAYRAEFLRVREIDFATQTIELAARHSLGPLEGAGDRRYLALNLLEELDLPGEWYLDRRTGVLYVWPPSNLRQPEITVSIVQPALVHCVGASYVEFRSLGLEASRQDGIRIEGGRGCRVVGCEIRNVGRIGASLEGDAHVLVGCDVHNTGTVGVALAGGDRRTLTGGAVTAENNHIHHTNRIARAGLTAASLDGVGHHLTHSLIHDTGYIAVRFIGNDHVIELNRVFRTNTETSEGGVFYTGRDWTSRGTVLRHNFVHHVEDSQEGLGSATRFLHLDDSAPGIEIYGNVCYRIGGGVAICGGADNHVHDNLFVECLWGASIAPRAKDMFSSDGEGGFILNPNRWNWTSLVKRLERCAWTEPPYSTKYPRLPEIFYKEPIAAPWFNTIERNVMVDCGRSLSVQGMEPAWSTIEANWSGSDPGFVEEDRTKLDFRLRPDAEVYEMGFRPIPFEGIGLYESPERRSWPVALDLPAPDWKPRWMRLKELAANSPGALPIFKVAGVTGEIVIDGVVDPIEWTPGDATGVNPEIHETAFLEWKPDKTEALHASQALIEVDDANLYVGFRNEVDPAARVSGGHVWGQDDAVEVALAEVRDKIGETIVLRGYTDGHWESSDEAGAAPDTVARAGTGVTYAVDVAGKSTWSAEWKIPFEALGIDPAAGSPKLVFNLSARKPYGDEWVMWKRSGGTTWDLTKSGFLWLAPLGDVVFDAGVPSRARIDIDARKTGLMLTPGRGCDVAEWATPVGSYLTGDTDSLPGDEWRDMVYEFTPLADGVVTLKLMGNYLADPGSEEWTPVWSYFDDITVEGAELENGGLEPPGAKGIPEGWRRGVGTAYWIHDPAVAAEGEYCAKVWHNGRFAQELTVVEGRTVTIRAKVRGSGALRRAQ